MTFRYEMEKTLKDIFALQGHVIFICSTFLRNSHKRVVNQKISKE